MPSSSYLLDEANDILSMAMQHEAYQNRINHPAGIQCGNCSGVFGTQYNFLWHILETHIDKEPSLLDHLRASNNRLPIKSQEAEPDDFLKWLETKKEDLEGEYKLSIGEYFD